MVTILDKSRPSGTINGIFPTPVYGAVDIKQITKLELDFVEKQKSKIRKNDGNTATLDTYVLEQVVLKTLKMY